MTGMRLHNIIQYGELSVVQRSRGIAKRGLLLFLATLLAGGGFVGWHLYANASALAGTSNPIKLVSSFTPSDLQTTNGRINILLAGYSADDAGHAGAELTDSIMIVSINPTTKSAVLLSVPRDLYVNIPGYGYSKINAAYEYGGMELLEQTITQDFGVQFGYYALLNYTAFKSAVDAVGGVSVDIESANSAGLYDPNTDLQLSNGITTLTGQAALNLARARGEGYGSYGFTSGDFDRTLHQQQILVALKNKIASISTFTNPLKLAKLADAVGSNVKTDMTIGEMETLFTKVKNIPATSVQSVALNNVNGANLLASYTSPSGQSTLIPADGIDDYSTIQATVNSLFAN